MNKNTLRNYFAIQWPAYVRKLSISLEEDDRLAVECIASESDFMATVVDQAGPSIARIAPALYQFAIFTDIFETQLGVALTADYVWGILARLLQLVADNCDERQILDAVRQLCWKAETFNAQWTYDPPASSLAREVCFEMQLVFVESFTHATQSIQGSRPGSAFDLTCSAAHFVQGSEIHQSVSKALLVQQVQLKSLLSRLKRQARNTHGLAYPPPTAIPRPGQASDVPQTTFLAGPTSGAFFDRVGIFQKLDKAFLARHDRIGTQPVVLSGSEGIGKTSVASAYLEKRYSDRRYQVALWIYGETHSSLRQSFTNIALHLELPGADDHSHSRNLALVQQWLRLSANSCLLIYDNVVCSKSVQPFLPSTGNAHVMVTTRSLTIAAELEAIAVEMSALDAATGAQFIMHLLHSVHGTNGHADANVAWSLSENLGGNALAIALSTALIHQGDFTVPCFIAELDKLVEISGLPCKLIALWNYMFSHLDTDSLTMLGVIAYLMPDGIPQSLFQPGVDVELPSALKFCQDTYRLTTTLKKLRALALIDWNRNVPSITCHRVVQSQVRHFLSIEARQASFNYAVDLVQAAFPTMTASGQMYPVWGNCNKFIQHALYLRDSFCKETECSRSFEAPPEFCNLLTSCQRYLLETSSFHDLAMTCDVNLAAAAAVRDEYTRNNFKAHTLSHQAVMAESLGQADTALRLNAQALDIRIHETPQRPELISIMANNHAYFCNAANKHEASLSWLMESRAWWATANAGKDDPQDLYPQAFFNMARCRLLLKDPTEARKMLKEVLPRLQASTSEWATLAHAYFVFGCLDREEHDYVAAEAHFIQAQNAWLTGDPTGVDPFNGGCMYKIGLCCLDQDRIGAAIKHLRDSIKVTELHKDLMPIEHARNLFRLSDALARDTHASSLAQVESLREQAQYFLRQRNIDAVDNETYDRHISILHR